MRTVLNVQYFGMKEKNPKRYHLTFRSIRKLNSRAAGVCGDSLEAILTGELLIWLILRSYFKSSAEVRHIQAVLLDFSCSLLPCLSTYSMEKDLSIF